MPLTRDQQAEVDAQRAGTQPTRRATVAALEEILYQPIAVLDHGFVRVIDYMGDDAAIVQAARVSYGRGTRLVSEDRGLIHYLMRHRHSTPFEMCEIKYHVKLPIFVARQWIRTRTASVNEYSGRYSLLPLLFYRPAPEHFQPQSATNRQGRSGGSLEAIYADAVERWERVRRLAAEQYEWLVQRDVARELARIDLPLSTYTQWYWKIDLHNLIHFLSLRADPHAQYEIRAFARVMAGMLKRVAPLSFEAWLDYDHGGTHLSRGELAALRCLIEVRGRDLEARRDAHVTAADLASLGLSKREVDELLAKLAAPPPADDFELDLSAARPAEHFARVTEAAVPRVDRK